MKLNISAFFQSSPNVFLFRHLSPRIAQWYLHSIGFIYYIINRREKRVIEKNVREVLAGKGDKHVRKVIRETFKGIFTHYFEKMFSAFLDHRTVERYVKDHFEIQGGELIEKALAMGKWCILVTAHWGAVEFIPLVLHVRGFPASIILECATARLAQNLREQGTLTKTELISSANGSSIFLRAMQSLKANRVLMTQCDEVDVWRRRKSSTITLFGRELFFDNAIDILSHRSGAPVVAAFLKRMGASRYSLILEDVSVQKKAESMARDCLELWERYVTLNPEQWYQWKKWTAMKAA